MLTVNGSKRRMAAGAMYSNKENGRDREKREGWRLPSVETREKI
jgi:hypothetical protein